MASLAELPVRPSQHITIPAVRSYVLPWLAKYREKNPADGVTRRVGEQERA
jgi:hypothetical protein